MDKDITQKHKMQEKKETDLVIKYDIHEDL